MKTKPKVGDRVWYRLDSGNKIRGTVSNMWKNLGGTLVTLKLDHPTSSMVDLHTSRLSGFVVKKKRVCDECAKPKELFYIGHNGDIGNYSGVTFRTKSGPLEMWKYISTVAVISTEENKK